MADLGPGTLLLHRSGAFFVIRRRKDDGTGWWLHDGAGVVDEVLDGPDWAVAGRDDLHALFAEVKADVLSTHDLAGAMVAVAADIDDTDATTWGDGEAAGALDALEAAVDRARAKAQVIHPGVDQ